METDLMQLTERVLRLEQALLGPPAGLSSEVLRARIAAMPAIRAELAQRLGPWETLADDQGFGRQSATGSMGHAGFYGARVFQDSQYGSYGKWALRVTTFGSSWDIPLRGIPKEHPAELVMAHADLFLQLQGYQLAQGVNNV